MLTVGEIDHMRRVERDLGRIAESMEEIAMALQLIVKRLNTKEDDVQDA